MRKIQTSKQSGFTLIELLVVIGILAILLAITLIAINPNKHFQDSRNTQRRSDVSAVLDAVYSYESANSGVAPTSVINIGSTAQSIAKGTALAASGATTFGTPNLTYPVASGGTAYTVGTAVTVTGCTQSADNGTFLVSSNSATTVVVTNASGVAGATSCSLTAGVNVCSDLTPTYIADIPKDPSTGTVSAGTSVCAATTYSTGYTIAQSNGRFTINAPSAEGGAAISVTR